MPEHHEHLPDSVAPPPEVPARLASDLVRLAGSAAPSALDRRVLSAACAEMRSRRMRRRMLIASGPLAAAACIGLTAIVAWPRLNARRVASMTPPVESPSGFAAGESSDAADLNRDGKVDILDALVLARRVESLDAGVGVDVTGDGRIDRADVDAIGARVVRLGSAAPKTGGGEGGA